MKYWIGGGFLILVLIGLGFWSTLGDGGLKRMVTMSGIYAVCKPGGYDAVCFLDADSREGGLSCLPLAQIGGECKK